MFNRFISVGDIELAYAGVTERFCPLYNGKGALNGRK